VPRREKPLSVSVPSHKLIKTIITTKYKLSTSEHFVNTITDSKKEKSLKPLHLFLLLTTLIAQIRTRNQGIRCRQMDFKTLFAFSIRDRAAGGPSVTSP